MPTTGPTGEEHESNASSAIEKGKGSGVRHEEFAPTPGSNHNVFKISRAGGGDTAMALFSDPGDVHEPYDAVEERRLVRKIDWMILPYLAVCYAFL